MKHKNDIYNTLGVALDLWQLPTTGDNETIETTEFWLHHATNKVKVSTQQVSSQRREAWLDEHTQGEGEGAKSLLARFVWVVANADDNRIELCESVQQLLLHRFGLRLANKYFKTFYSGIVALPRESKQHMERRSFAYCYGPKQAAIWSHTVRKDTTAEPITEGFMFLRSSPKKQAASGMKGGTALQFQTLLQSAPWSPTLCRSSAFPAYLTSLVLSKEITQAHAKIGMDVRDIEARTGYHEFENRDSQKLDRKEDLGVVSARASGHATKLASVTRKSKMLEKLLDFVMKMEGEDKEQRETFVESRLATTPFAEDEQDLLKDNIDVLRQRLDMQKSETEYALKRVQIQIDALFNLISQKDSLHNLDLAIWTRNVSMIAQRDAASMKTLAVVTMFFLPGSFISALFSTPLFTWDDVDQLDKSNIGVGTTPQFGLYWAVTVPLTVITFLLYFLWLWWQHHQRGLQEARNGDIPGSSAVQRHLSESDQAGLAKKRLAEKDLIAARRETYNDIPMTAPNSWRKDDVEV